MARAKAAKDSPQGRSPIASPMVKSPDAEALWSGDRSNRPTPGIREERSRPTRTVPEGFRSWRFRRPGEKSSRNGHRHLDSGDPRQFAASGGGSQFAKPQTNPTHRPPYQGIGQKTSAMIIRMAAPLTGPTRERDDQGAAHPDTVPGAKEPKQGHCLKINHRHRGGIHIIHRPYGKALPLSPSIPIDSRPGAPVKMTHRRRDDAPPTLHRRKGRFHEVALAADPGSLPVEINGTRSRPHTRRAAGGPRGSDDHLAVGPMPGLRDAAVPVPAICSGNSIDGRCHLLFLQPGMHDYRLAPSGSGSGDPPSKRLRALASDYFTSRHTDAGNLLWVPGSDVIGPMGPAVVPLGTEEDMRAFRRRHGGWVPFTLEDLTIEQWEAIRSGRDPSP